MGNNVESDGFGERAALSACNDVAFLHGKRGGAMNGDVLVPLLITTILRNVVQIVPSDNDRALHFGGDNHTSQDSSSNGNITCERALLVHVAPFDGSIWCLDAETDVLHEAHGLLTGVANSTLAGYEDTILLLVCFFMLCSR